MGAEVYVCPAHVPADDPKSYYEVAKKLHKETKDSIYINQYFNELEAKRVAAREAKKLARGRGRKNKR